MTAMLTRQQYADEVGASVRAVDRWISAGLLADVAVRQGRSWYIPSGTPRPMPDGSATSRDVAPVAPVEMPGMPGGALWSYQWEPPAPERLGELVPLEEAARRLGTTEAVVRRLGRAGKLDVGPYGERGRLAVWVTPA